MIIIREQAEIDEQLNKASETLDEGSKFFGMSYEEGILAMFDWLVGNREDAPMDQ